MADTIAEAIDEAAKGPQSVTVDGMSVTAPDIDKLIRADQYAKANTGIEKNHCGLRFRTLKPGGCG